MRLARLESPRTTPTTVRRSADARVSLKINEQMAGRFIEALNCAAAVVARGGRIEHVNDRLCILTGYDRDELVGHRIQSFYVGAEDQAMVERLTTGVAFDEAREFETHLPRRDRSPVSVMASGRPLDGADGQSMLRLVTFIDISALKDADRLVADQRDVLAELNDTVIAQALDLKRQAKVLEQRVAERTAQLYESNMAAIYMLAVASEAKDADTGRHVRRVRRYAAALARAYGCSDAEAKRIGYSAMLHDVGKLHIPDDILQKPGPLTDEERRLMQRHTIVGEDILSSQSFFDVARRIARSHHENWDGSGYPDRLAGDSIPPPARIVHLVDVYDAMTHRRPYKAAWSREKAIEVIQQESGASFEPDLVRCFVGLSRRGAIDRVEA